METNESTTTQQKPFPMGLMAIVLIVVLGIGIFVYQSRMQSSESMQKEVEVQQMAKDKMEDKKEMTDAKEDSDYKNGSYEATGSYKSPVGEESIGVKLTLEDDIVTEVEIEKMATKPKSVEFQDIFIAGYKEMVIGKEIDEIKLDKVAGSSLTPQGFNDAIEKIKTQAEA